jgi:D-alanyl-lipoteichoic acid acyltransferase DltB (MBOAT superfamily)
MQNLYVSDLFFLHAAGAVVAFRTVAARLAPWLRQVLLILISVYFLTWLTNFRILGPVLILYVVAAIMLGYLSSRQGRRAGILFAVGCSMCIAILAAFKYLHLLPGLDLWDGFSGVGALQWIGLSYLTFRTIDLLTTWHSQPDPGTGPSARTRWLYGCSYLLFFPGYVSGPINRFQAFIDEQASRWTPMTLARARANLLRITLGIIKILLLGRLAYSCSLLGPHFPGFTAVNFPVLAASLFALLLYYYFDFSGYCDVAIALADFFEVRLPENFNYPFLAMNPQEFWNRWHVSLTLWLRDFVFFRLLRYLNAHWPAIPDLLAAMASSFVTLLLMGAWHGHTLNWVLYGCYHGAALCLHMAYQAAMDTWSPELYDRLRGNFAYRLLCLVLTISYVALGLLFTLPLDRLSPLLLWASGTGN